MHAATSTVWYRKALVQQNQKSPGRSPDNPRASRLKAVYTSHGMPPLVLLPCIRALPPAGLQY